MGLYSADLLWLQFVADSSDHIAKHHPQYLAMFSPQCHGSVQCHCHQVPRPQAPQLRSPRHEIEKSQGLEEGHKLNSPPAVVVLYTDHILSDGGTYKEERRSSKSKIFAACLLDRLG